MGEGGEGRSRGEKGVVEMEEGRGLSLNLGREGKGRPDDIFKDVCSIGFVEGGGAKGGERWDIVFFFSAGGRPGRQIYRSKISKSNLTQASKSSPVFLPPLSAEEEEALKDEKEKRRCNKRSPTYYLHSSFKFNSAFSTSSPIKEEVKK